MMLMNKTNKNKFIWQEIFRKKEKSDFNKKKERD